MAIIAPEEHIIGYYTFSLLCFSIIGVLYAKGRLFDFLASLIATIVLITVIFCLFYTDIKNFKDVFSVIMWILVFGYSSLKVIFKLKFGLVKDIKKDQEQIHELNEKENNE